MKLAPISLLALACCAAPLAARAGIDVGIAVGGPEFVVRTPPPPERLEVIHASPGPGYTWVRGHWAWRRDSWQWAGGRWDRPAQPGAEWIPGRWIERGNAWVWVEGRYAVQAPAPLGRGVEVIAAEAPPEPIIEALPFSPGPDYFWVGGHWHWNHGWVWLGGHYDRHPHFHPGGYWESGHWDRRGGGFVWFEGRWR